MCWGVGAVQVVVTDVPSNSALIEALCAAPDILAAPLGDVTDEEFRQSLLREAGKLAGPGGAWAIVGFLLQVFWRDVRTSVLVPY